MLAWEAKSKQALEATRRVVSDATEGGGPSREALALPSDRHDELLQRDVVHALREVCIPGGGTHTVGEASI